MAPMMDQGFTAKNYPLTMVTSCKFGRVPKISAEKTFNMFISDGWLVSFAGYKKVADIVDKGEGRGLFASTRANRMFEVSNNEFYDIDESLTVRKRGILETSSGDVTMAENLANEIVICDQKDLYIFNYSTNVFVKVSLDFTPAYVEFQNGYFIAPDADRAEWRLSALNNGLSWPAAAQNVGEFQTKADKVRATIPVPGKSNQLFVMGNIVTESWTDVGFILFPYQKSSAFNIDYGCLNQDTIAKGDNFVIWLGVNEKSGPVILISEGGAAIQISSDGINLEFQQLTKPSDSYGALVKQDGHIFYILTFPTDNKTYVYDITTKQFYFLTDENQDHFIAKKIVFFNEKYYFISFIDGNLYELSSDINTYDGALIPRIVVTPTFRLPASESFIADYLSFTMEQGENPDMERIDMSLSKDGGVSFGNIVGIWQMEQGKRANEIKVWEMGYANEITFQFRFWGNGRTILYNGILGVYV
jgi:hypothetical protein